MNYVLFRYVASYCNWQELNRPVEARQMRELTWESERHLKHNEVEREALGRLNGSPDAPFGYKVVSVKVLRVTIEEECVHHYS